MAKPEPKPHVKKHLKDRGIDDPSTLPDDVIDALNAFDEVQLANVDNLGDALMKSQVPNKISVVH
jgi:hypothetical protein